MNKVKITAVRKTEYPDLMEKYENPILHTCDVLIGQSWISENGQRPEGLCESAWGSMLEFVEDLAAGKGDFFDGIQGDVHRRGVEGHYGHPDGTYMLELWKTARKHRTAALVVTQELKDITSSPIIKDSIVENSGVKILLDQTKYVNRFEELAGQLSLSDDDKAMVLSLNRFKMPGRAGHDAGREVFFNLGNKKSFMMRLEVSPEERIAFSSAKKDKIRLAAAVEKSGGLVFDRT